MSFLGEIRTRINCRIIRRILKSALVFEPDSYKLYISIRNAVKKSLDGSQNTMGVKETPPIIAALNSLINQEKMHEELIRKIVDGEMKCSRLKTALQEMLGIRLNNIEDIRPLEREINDSISLKINEAVKQEENSLKFYMRLYRMSKIGSVKEAFRSLADQEALHLLILKKLAGKDVFTA